MRIPQDQIDLLQDISKVNENVIGILSAGSAIEMPWCCGGHLGMVRLARFI